MSDASPAPRPRRAAASLGGGVVSRVEIKGTALKEYGHGGGGVACRNYRHSENRITSNPTRFFRIGGGDKSLDGAAGGEVKSAHNFDNTGWVPNLRWDRV